MHFIFLFYLSGKEHKQLTQSTKCSIFVENVLKNYVKSLTKGKILQGLKDYNLHEVK